MNDIPFQDIFEEAVSIESLSLGWEDVQKNAGCAGGDGVTIEKFARYAVQNLRILHYRLMLGSYVPAPLRTVTISKPSKGIRILSIPSVGDRVVQSAFLHILMPFFNSENIGLTDRQGYNIYSAVSYIEHMYQEGFVYLIEGDIETYYHSVVHDTLVSMLRCIIHDERMIALVQLWLDDFSSLGTGLPQGSPLSPLLAHLYLNALDTELSKKNIRIVRFADNFILLCKIEKTPNQTLKEVSEFLTSYGIILDFENTPILDFNKSAVFLGRLFTYSVMLKHTQEKICQNLPEMPKALPYLTIEAKQISIEEQDNIDNVCVTHPVLYVLDSGVCLDAHHNHFIIKDSVLHKEIFKAPAAMVLRIEIGQEADITKKALILAYEQQIKIDFIGADHKRVGTSLPVMDTNIQASVVHLRQADHVLHPEKHFILARIFVIGKIYNQRIVLKRLMRTKKIPIVQKICDDLKHILRTLGDISVEETVQTLLNYGDNATQLYHQGLSFLIDNPHWQWTRQQDKHYPTHAGAVLMNIFSNLLVHDMKAILCRTDLHQGFGFLYDISDALAYDMIEEFHPLLVEGFTVYLMNNRNIVPEDFMMTPKGRIVLSKGLYRESIIWYEKRVHREVVAPDGEKVTWRGLMEKQVFAFKKHIMEGKIYVPYRADY